MGGNPNSNSGKPPTGPPFKPTAFGGASNTAENNPAPAVSNGGDASAAAFGGNQTYTFDAPFDHNQAAALSPEDNPWERQRDLPPRIYSGTMTPAGSGGSAPFSFGGSGTSHGASGETYTFDAPPEETINFDFSSFIQSDAARRRWRRRRPRPR